MSEASAVTLTAVTALLDIGRGSADTGLAADHLRSFDDYLKHFRTLLALDLPLVIYTSPDLEPEVWRLRRRHNTEVRTLTVTAIEQDFPAYNRIQQIRQDPGWRSQASWLAGSPQATLPHYNPLVMSKLGLLDASAEDNPFQSDALVWLDAGLARTCGAALADPAWPSLLAAQIKTFLLLSFPYLGGSEIHGFERPAMARWSGGEPVRWVARGGLFGGRPAAIRKVCAVYDACLEATLAAGHMGTEESILTIIAHRHPDLFQREPLAEDGLIAPYLERLVQASKPTQRAADGRVGTMPAAAPPPPLPTAERPALSIYVLTFNCPRQLALLLASWADAFQAVHALQLYIVDQSTAADCQRDNQAICQRYGGRYLAPGNLGICGGRQFIADHFADSGAAYMLFLEDDMLHATQDGTCRSGFARRVDRLLPRALAILVSRQLDFLKLSFTEFYGSNDQQWAWHNVTEERRAQLWPQHPKRTAGLALEQIPPANFSQLGQLEGLPYALGEVFYCNWPQLVSRAGNRRMFLDRRWPQPHEQFWMAHLYERARRGELRGGVLLASPIEHRREFHYAAGDRRES